MGLQCCIGIAVRIKLVFFFVDFAGFIDFTRRLGGVKWPSNVPSFSTNLLVVYRESVNLIGYITRRLSADSQQL